MTRTIRREMTKAPFRIGDHVSINEAKEVMQTWGMRHLPVTDSSDKLTGILSERDFSRLFGSNLSGSSPVCDIMTINPYSVYPETSLQTVVKEMAETKIGSAVIVNYEREVVGIFTTTDAMKVLSKMLVDDDDGEYRTIKISEYLFGNQHGIA
jgi:CBS domain-containing protein